MGAAIGGAVTGMGDRSKVTSKVRWPKMSPKSERGGKVAGGLVSTSTDQACTAWAVWMSGTEPNPVCRVWDQGDGAGDASLIPVQPQVWEGGPVTWASFCKTSQPPFVLTRSYPLTSESSSPPRRWQLIHNGHVFIRVMVPLSAEKSNAILLMKVMCRDRGGWWELLGLVWPRLKTFRENTNFEGHTQKVPFTSVRPICFALEQ